MTSAAGPDDRGEALRRAVRLEWVTLAFVISAVTLVYLVMGSSQAMRTAWIEDILALVPPVAFLVASRVARKPATANHPFGFHRASAVGHLVAGTALFGVGAFLVYDSAVDLLSGEHPPISTVVVLGQPVWQGWLMVAAMVYTAIVPAVLGRMKLRLAPVVNDKVLYADADMNKADWLTAVAAILGVLGIGVGLWWADAVAALVISTSVLKDGVGNMRGAVRDLMDARATTVDHSEPLPLIRPIEDAVAGPPWVADSHVRVRDMGRAVHVEAFVVPDGGYLPSPEDLAALREHVLDLDEAVIDVVVMPVRELPAPAG
ncbi:cation diffusion facilitator family transporter [Georgenia sp. 10Sc9-8]|uniref:Cation diffusion facilitator family transporter n=1 Tax=Georgenia halotolerans TaxID=3028317 RepID=A0ABT5U1K9_9MICO|nr:cation diffusion facilitator family transporter [Georgenia halotolerans]